MAIAIVERVINKSQCMDCPLGQNKVALVERWPLVEVCLYQRHEKHTSMYRASDISRGATKFR